jgi:hypothetical protein
VRNDAVVASSIGFRSNGSASAIRIRRAANRRRRT